MKKFLLKLIVSLGVLAFILWQLGGLDEVGNLILRINLGFVALILLANTLDRALMTYKWLRLLASKGERLPFFRGMKIYCASMVWGLFLPSTVGADAIRAFSIARLGLNSNVVISSIVIERIFGFFTALIFGVLGVVLLSLTVPLGSLFAPLMLATGIMIGGALILFSMLFSRSLYYVIHTRILRKYSQHRLVTKFAQLHSTYLSFREDRRSLSIFFGLTLFEQLFSILFAWLIAIALGIDVSLLILAGILPISMLFSRLPLSLDGIGIFEGIFAILMSLGGVSAVEAVTLALAARLLNLITWLPWWAAHVWETNRLKAPRSAEVS